MTQNNNNTEETILNAALKIFKQKGFDGTTVQDIAVEAGTTKSMVNYYFRSKEKLFLNIFYTEFKNLFSSLASFIGSDLPLKSKIEKIVEIDIDRLSEIPDLPIFILTEVNHNPDIVFKNLGSFPIDLLISGLSKQISEEVHNGKIKYIDAKELLINIQSLTIYPFLAKPMLINVLGLTENNFKEMLIKRKKDVPEIIWQSLAI